MDAHQRTCDYRIVKCNLQTCKITCIAKDLDDHKKNVCDFTIMKCSQGCNQNIYRKQLKSHNCVTTCAGLIDLLQKKVDSQKTTISSLQIKVEMLFKSHSSLEEQLKKLQ
jgi:glutamine amidotransferase PdxT